MNVSTQKFQSQKTVNKPLAQSNHRTTLPQSALSGCQLPQRGSRDAGCTIQCAAQKPQRCGRFSSPLRNSKIFTFNHSSNDTPSASLRSAAPSEREPGCGLYHSTCRSETATLRAIFIAPTKLRSFYILPFTKPKNTIFPKRKEKFL